jgi:hypothetical protein
MKTTINRNVILAVAGILALLIVTVRVAPGIYNLMTAAGNSSAALNDKSLLAIQAEMSDLRQKNTQLTAEKAKNDSLLYEARNRYAVAESTIQFYAGRAQVAETQLAKTKDQFRSEAIMGLVKTGVFIATIILIFLGAVTVFKQARIKVTNQPTKVRA